MAKTPESEILGPEPKYNEPDLSPQDFLVAVYQDKRLPMATRIDAASKVSVYMHPRLAQITQDVTAGVTIRIEGGLPALPGTNIIMPEHTTAQGNLKGTSKGNGQDPDTQ